MKKTIRGGVSMYVMLSMGVLLTFSLGVSSLAISSLTRVKQDRNSVIAQQVAFAALDHMTGKAWNDLEGNNGKLVYTALNVSTDVSPLATGATANVWITPSSDKLGYVTATASYKGITRSVRSYIQAREVGIWNNAIFAGSGAQGQAINGNVDIRGSMHILGDGEPYTDLNGNGTHDNAETFTDMPPKNGIYDPGEPYVDANGDGAYTYSEPYNDTNLNGLYDPPLTQTSLDTVFGGTAYVGNNYSGMPSQISSIIPTIPTISGVGQLGTEVRVKHGMISINGSATIGTSSIIDGGLSKNTVDGMYVSDGYTGNQGASAVFSDNGTSNTYDLGNLPLQMPIISGIGAQTYKDKNGTSWTTHEQYLDTKSLVVPVSTITASTAAFSYGPDVNGNSISFTPQSGSTPAKITVNGVVKIAGNLQIGDKDSITYAGSGTMYATGNINVDGNLLPAAGLKFPTTTRIGLIAKQNMNLATGNGSSQLSMAGAFYAQGTIKSAKQNQIAGTFVASFYDMGTNVPNIYQVPSLTSNMPPAMPGDKRYYTLKVKSFRDRSPAPGQTDSFSGGTPYQGTTGGGGASTTSNGGTGGVG